MAAPNASQALYEMSQILLSDPWETILFDIHAHRGMFGVWDHRDRSYLQLSPSRDMLAVWLWTPCTFSRNLRIAMLMEAVGLGPQRYCIVFSSAPDFYSKLKLILYSLPQEKMFLYPVGTTLGGPFLHEPWLSRARVIQSRPSLTEEEYVESFVPSAMVSL